jgi:serine/threonine protein kinase
VSERLTRIGKYEVECVIGEGAMGVVYRAVDPVINRRVAIKVMNDAVAQDAGLRERFLREAQAAGSLQHPNLVTVYDFGEIGDHLYTAMEYVEGDDLSELLRKQLAIPVDQSLDLVIGLLHGLAYAHKRGIVHRDIKPANIRVDGEGKARLMDFGVAHLASSEMTSTGVLLGTPSYMAPEQITGSPVSPETDIFSVGAVLYELLARRRPFEGETLQALMYQIVTRMPASLDAVVPEIPPALGRIVMRALEKEPSQRYRNAVAMANDLATMRDTLDSEGKHTSTSLRATIDTALADERDARHRRKRQRRVVIVTGGVLAAAALFATVRTLWRIGTPVPPPAAVMAASPSTPRSLAPDSSRPTVTQPPAPSPLTTTQAPAPPRATLDSRTRTGGIGAPTPPPRARDERNLAAGAAAAPVQPTPREPTPVERPPTVAQQSAVGAPIVAPSPAAPAQEPRENAAAQIAAVVAAYARALESRDIGELRRVYPSMTSEQRSAFEDFFRSTRSLQATLSVAGLQIDGSSAEANLTGSFDYVTTAGAAEHRPVSFRAALRREGSTWMLVAVR